MTDVQFDLFKRTRKKYPHAPGHRSVATSREAAERFESKAATIERKVLATFVAAGHAGLTEFEVVAILGIDRDAAQPRVSELKKKHKIVPTGERRRNPRTGMSCEVLRVCNCEEASDEFSRGVDFSMASQR